MIESRIENCFIRSNRVICVLCSPAFLDSPSTRTYNAFFGENLLLEHELHPVEDSSGQIAIDPPLSPVRNTEPNKPAYPILPVGVRIAAAVLTLIIPGSGHFLLKRPVRGTVYFLCVTAMFVFGIILQGHLFTFTNSGDWLSRFFAIFDAGLGLPYLVCYLTGAFTQAVSIAPSFEYGNTFLMVAGLLNYLIMLDGFDIAAGRKA